jgi:hypothetical protein
MQLRSTTQAVQPNIKSQNQRPKIKPLINPTADGTEERAMHGIG